MRGGDALLPGKGFDEERLLAPEQALVAYLSRAQLAPLPLERVTLDEAFGRVLAQRAIADSDYPAGARSTMDGFAVAATAVPARLRIAGEIRMGQAWPHPLEPGSALRIPTGGLLPAGAQAVVPLEDVRMQAEYVEIPPAAPGDCTVARGADMRAGEPVLEPGRLLGGAELGVLATLGIAEVTVRRRPVFGVLSSGDELIGAAEQPRPGQIRDSNRWAVAGTLRALGACVVHLPTAADDAAQLEERLRYGLDAFDGVVLTGGSSVGERDLTPEVVDRLGAPGVIVHGLKVRPGKPTVLAAVAGKPVIGLPGNPASALMILEAVAAPVVAQLVGAEVPPQTLEARLDEPYEKRPGWTWFVPVALSRSDGELRAHPLPMRSSSVSLLARAGGFLRLDEAVSSLPAGAPVVVTRFSSGGRACP